MQTPTLSPSHAFGDLEPYRGELTAYCYRMLGSPFDAEDAVQDAFVRAWRSRDRFEGRSAVRAWLYRLATNVCLDMLKGKERRARPMDLGPACEPIESNLNVPAEITWLEPIPLHLIAPERDPAEVAIANESIRLAFVTALQHLPARQRAVLILREVLGWHATEVAELLDTSVASVNSALQRARATLAARDHTVTRGTPIDASQQELLDKYVAAFERYDISTLVTLLHDDAIQSMPPYAMWLLGPDAIQTWLLGPGFGCRGSRLVPVAANGGIAFGQYRVDPQGGHAPWALQILEVSDDRISGFHSFLDTDLFSAFGLPAHLDS